MKIINKYNYNKEADYIIQKIFLNRLIFNNFYKCVLIMTFQQLQMNVCINAKLDI